jgi:hypothetical protein
MISLGEGGSVTDLETWDFFISFNKADQAWAEWIAWELEERGRRVLIQTWDMVPGSNWPLLINEGMRRGGRLIAVVSPSYLSSVVGTAEWQGVWATDPDGKRRRIIPVLVSAANTEQLGLLGSRTWIDLSAPGYDLDIETARNQLLTGIAAAESGRSKPMHPVPFPRLDSASLSSGNHDRISTRFFFDENLVGAAKIIASLRGDVTYPGHYRAKVERAASDIEIISSVSKSGLTLITQDWGLATQGGRLDARFKDIKILLLTKSGRTRWDAVRVLMWYWESIEKLADQDGPWVKLLGPTGITTRVSHFS